MSLMSACSDSTTPVPEPDFTVLLKFQPYGLSWEEMVAVVKHAGENKLGLIYFTGAT
jgi:hypothetical protein